MARKKMPERFLKADPDSFCEKCDKVRKLCRFCGCCKEHCECPICSLCGRADMSCCNEFIAEVGDGCTDPCRCEYCWSCNKLIEGDYLCLLPNENGRWCEKCFDKVCLERGISDETREKGF